MQDRWLHVHGIESKGSSTKITKPNWKQSQNLEPKPRYHFQTPKPKYCSLFRIKKKFIFIFIFVFFFSFSSSWFWNVYSIESNGLSAKLNKAQIENRAIILMNQNPDIISKPKNTNNICLIYDIIIQTIHIFKLKC